jgi:hypothetical protein
VDRKISDLATNEDTLCPTNLGTARLNWTGWGNGATFTEKSSDFLSNPKTVMSPFTSLPGSYGGTVDVTQVVQSWVAGTAQDYGFIFSPNWSKWNGSADTQECFSYLGGFELDVQYFTPPN